MAKDIHHLVSGYKKFRKKYFDTPDKPFEKLVRQGQQPKIMIISCCDSRVDPSIILDCEPGDLFVIRNVANLVPPYETNGSYHGTSAAMEFGICNLGIENIIVLGHSLCGGIQALVQNADLAKDGFISKWMEMAAPARQKALALHAHDSFETQCTACAQYALMNSLKNLQTFPWIKQRIENGDVSLHAWYFDLSSGLIHILDQENETFDVLSA